MDVCNPEELPAVSSSFCAPDLNFGQISDLYLGNLGNVFTDWSLLSEWTDRLDNSATNDLTKIRHLHGIGDKPAAESNSVSFSKGRKVNTEKNHTINFKIDETNPENYALIQWFENNANQSVLGWYAGGKYIYGGNSGITMTVLLDDVIPESEQELNYFQGVITFEGGTPDRILNPLA